VIDLKCSLRSVPRGSLFSSSLFFSSFNINVKIGNSDPGDAGFTKRGLSNFLQKLSRWCLRQLINVS
jgi:hypothetical protein